MYISVVNCILKQTWICRVCWSPLVLLAEDSVAVLNGDEETHRAHQYEGVDGWRHEGCHGADDPTPQHYRVALELAPLPLPRLSVRHTHTIHHVLYFLHNFKNFDLIKQFHGFPWKTFWMILRIWAKFESIIWGDQTTRSRTFLTLFNHKKCARP